LQLYADRIQKNLFLGKLFIILDILFYFSGYFFMLSGGFCNPSNFGHQDFAALTLMITYVSLLYIVDG
jgi:hypothetical protein